RSKGFFQPEQTIGLEAAKSIERRLDVPGETAIDQQRRIRADRLTKSTDNSHISHGVGTQRIPAVLDRRETSIAQPPGALGCFDDVPAKRMAGVARQGAAPRAAKQFGYGCLE